MVFDFALPVTDDLETPHLVLLALGSPYMILLVFVIQCLVYKEVTALFDLSFSQFLTSGVMKAGLS